MRDVFGKYWVVAHVAVLAGFLAWVHGGTRADHLDGVPWLSLAVLEVLLILPPTRKNETLEAARERTWRALLWDPLLYIGLALSGYLLFQSLNGGCQLQFDPESGKWAYGAPPVRWGPPFCVDPAEARQMLYWFPPALAAALGVRHGMNRRGKLVLLRLLAANSALLALFGLLQAASGTPRMFGITPLADRFFASFGYPNHAGAFFTLHAAAAAGLFAHALLTADQRRHAVWLGAALVLNLAGALCSLSRAAILFSLALLVFGGLYAIRHAWRQVSRGARLKAAAIYVCILVFGLGALFFAAPGNPVLRKVQTVNWARFGHQTFGLRMPQIGAAWEIWKDYPWFGVGGWGYRQFVCLYLDEGQRAALPRGAANVHNDILQFLTEHGAVGLGLMLGAVAVLLHSVGRRLRVAHVTHADGWVTEQWLLLRISPLTVFLLAGTAITFLQCLIDLPFRSPAVLVSWTVFLACAPGFLPARPTPPPGSAAPVPPSAPAAAPPAAP
jgi:hypothetical protein